MSNTEMSNRIVNARVKVMSGSDDHAKHTVYWALSGNGLLFLDDEIRRLEEIVTAVACGEEITDELIFMAAGLLKYGFNSSPAADVIEMTIEKKGGSYV